MINIHFHLYVSVLKPIELKSGLGIEYFSYIKLNA
jgi:hypothetical protein